MRVLVINRTLWNVTTYENVSSISYNSSTGVYTIVADSTLTFSEANYMIRLM